MPEKPNIKNFYSLSPMQEGMLFHEMMAEQPGVYVEQTAIVMQGAIDPVWVKQAFQRLVDRYDILRTVFVYKTTKRPRQVVLEKQEAMFNFTDIEDISSVSGKTPNHYLEDFIKKDRERGFDLTKGPLMRLHLFKTGPGSWRLLWTFHHILIDGWCLGILYDEFLALYRAAKTGISPGLDPVIPYSRYIKWLEKQDKQKGLDYWKAYLDGYELPPLLPRRSESSQTRQYLEGNYQYQINDSLTQQLRQTAVKNQVTENIVFQVLWGILLQRYANTGDAVFGAVTAGRPAEIPGVHGIVGLFINTVPVRINNGSPGESNGEKFSGILKKVQHQAVISKSYEYLSLAEIQALSPLKNRLIDHIISFENRSLKENIKQIGGGNRSHTGISVNDLTIHQQTNYDLNLLVSPSSRLSVEFMFNRAVYETGFIEKVALQLDRIVQQVAANPDIPVKNIDILSPEEKHKLLVEFNETASHWPKGKTIHELFECQVQTAPDRTAVIFEDKRLTYRELFDKAGRLAHILREKDVVPNSVVGIMLKRSLEMIIGIFGILKAGGAYLPIDPEYPQERIDFMLKDSGAKLLVTTDEKEGEKVRRWEGEKVHLNHLSFHHSSFIILHSSHLAYVIYTSGTTGKPKGVAIEHRSLVNRLNWMQKKYPIDRNETILQKTTYTFDVSVWEIFWWSIVGASVCLLIPGGEKDPGIITQTVERNHVTTMHFVPSMLSVFLDYVKSSDNEKRLSSLKQVIASGEALTLSHVERFNELLNKENGTQLANLYGPTEATIDVSYYDCSEVIEKEIIPIGKPIDNIRLYILDKHLHIQPVGISGELCIAGLGLARGYLNLPELTAEKFVPLPYIAGEFIYRTGDRASHLPDGNIEFQGRIDHQVKIRGFRIELGEIEDRLSRHDEISNAVVTVIEDADENKNLCACIVSKRELTGPELREYLARQLPDYMIPSYFINLEKIPVTANGKIDRNALPDPVGIGFRDNAGYIPPQNPVEKKLVEVWESVLNRNPIGINENFFHIGGDSIKSIQIISRMNMAGYRLEMKYLFKYPVISELAPHVTKSRHIPNQSFITGTIPLTPIQEMFFQQSHNHPHHYNLAVMLYAKEGFDKEILKKVFSKIQEHHDALRITYEIKTGNKEIRQINHDLPYPLSLEEYELKKRENPIEEFQANVNRIQASIDLQKGPLMKLGLFHLDDGDRLLIVVHHLVIDGVAWRILFEDIDILYGQYKRGEKPVLPPKTDSFKLWSEKLLLYSDSQAFLKEKTYWAQLESTIVPPIKKDFEVEENNRKDTRNMSVNLGEDETELLLTRVNRAFRTEINDILLTAVGMGIKKTFGQDRVLIALEGHGREDILEDVDISRTVGWFTGLYPVLLDMSYVGEQGPGRQIKEIKEILRRIPNKGIGYGILKYLTGEANKKEIQFQLKPQIGFNYLGQFDADLERKSVFEIAKEPVGTTRNLENRREYILEINGVIANGRLTMTFSYNETHFKPDTIKKLIGSFESELRHIIAFCCSREKVELTPSDLTYNELSTANLEELAQQYPIEDIYMLSPMQEGKLFYTFYNESFQGGGVQLNTRISGNLDLILFERSINEVFKRYDVLRALFLYEGVKAPMQIILKERQADFLYKDIREMIENGDKEFVIQEFSKRDRMRSFDLRKDVLLRMTVLKTGDREYEVIWSFHHILMDGWCLGIVFSDFVEIYNSLMEGRPSKLQKVQPFREYIQWLMRQDNKESEMYWKKYLDGFGKETGIPKRKRIGTDPKGYQYKRIPIRLDKDKTAKLQALAERSQVTLNTIVQTIWGIILGKYNRAEDVVFGAVVSGRPPEVLGVESMVGLFINTIPVRMSWKRETTFKELVCRVQKIAIDSEPYHHYPLAKIQSESILKRNLLDHILVFENYPLAAQVEGVADKTAKRTFDVINISEYTQPDYNIHLVIQPGGSLCFEFRFNALVYDDKILENFGLNIEEVADAIINNSDIRLEDIRLSDNRLMAKPSDRSNYIEDFGF